MIDFHSHILPALDDGAADTKESLAILRLLHAQGISTVVATPHFYADCETSDSFLQRRAVAAALLRLDMDGQLPKIICGAEVRYYSGISRMAGLSQLCIEGTRLLLLEMPSIHWTEYTVKELEELARIGEVTVVIAHIERYMRLQSAQTLARLYECGILVQCNASVFLSSTTKRRSLSMLREGKIHFIGSDCHNLTSRPPAIGRAYDVIKKKLGNEFLCELQKYGYSYFKQLQD